MKQFEPLTQILDSLFLGFGLSLVLILILSLFKFKTIKDLTSNFTHYSIIIIRVLGIGYFIFQFILLISNYYSNETFFSNSRATGPYAWAYWVMLLRPFVFCALSQLFWVKKIKNSKIKIFLLAILILFITFASGANFERFVIIVTSYHRDYLPSSWKMEPAIIDITLFIFLIVIKNILLYSSLVFITWFLSENVINKKLKNGIQSTTSK